MRRSIFRSKWVVLAAVAMLVVALGALGCAKKEEAPDVSKEPIVIGGIFDTTGPTSDVGQDYAVGVVDAADYINANGGINGRPVEVIANDYAYKPDKAVELYKTYKDKGIFLIMGWGTGDTNALKALVSKDEIVYISASYDSLINDPAKTPYNFYASASYGEAIRGAMQFVKESGKTKVVFIYPDHPYGKNPIPAGKAMAAELGLDVGPDQFVALNATDAISQLTNMKKFNPDWAWIGGTVASTAVIIKDAAKLGLDTKFLINVWGFDENLQKLAGDAVKERAYGMGPFAMWGADVPGMKAPMEMHKSKHPDDTHTVHYIQGWSSMMVMWEGMKKAKSLDGPSVKAAIETIKDFDTGGLTAPVTYTPTDHRPNTTLNINKMDAEGKIVTVKSVTLERRPEWLGQ
ncbi:MAG: ABC transporter substrate-binding protein [bacterium]|nr:ABC transporter substrate-binding protein [bacterium]MDT8365636.1 ABC transporter substrate-binding protein [bacterium]